MLYNIYHIYDVDGGFGDAVEQKRHVGAVEATEKEMEEFLSIWNKPRIYDNPYSSLYHHCVKAEPVEVKPLDEIVPYDPETRDWPDLPEGMYSGAGWNGSRWVDYGEDEDDDDE